MDNKDWLEGQWPKILNHIIACGYDMSKDQLLASCDWHETVFIDSFVRDRRENSRLARRVSPRLMIMAKGSPMLGFLVITGHYLFWITKVHGDWLETRPRAAFFLPTSVDKTELNKKFMLDSGFFPHSENSTCWGFLSSIEDGSYFERMGDLHASEWFRDISEFLPQEDEIEEKLYYFKGERKHVRIYREEIEHPAFRSLSPTAKAIYIELLNIYHGWNNGQIAISYKKLRENCGVTMKEVKGGVDELIYSGLIVKNKSNRYSITAMKDGKKKPRTEPIYVPLAERPWIRIRNDLAPYHY